jgi:hypothetical protein
MPKNLVVEHKSRNLLRRVSSAADAGQALDIVAESGAPLEVPISHVPPPNEPTDMIGRPTTDASSFSAVGRDGICHLLMYHVYMGLLCIYCIYMNK